MNTVGERTLEVTRRHESRAANTFRITAEPPVPVSGEGAWLVDARGRRFLDLACGSATTALGHGHPAHREAIERALASGILHTGTRLPSPFRARLYERLAAILPPHLDCFQLGNSGAEAVEAALKLAQYATGRKRILSFEGGYHGRTLGALSITHGARIRTPFATLDGLVDFLPWPARPADSDACLAAFEARIAALRQDLPAALVIEPVQGVSGVHEAPAAFLRALQARCRELGILFIVDEIWSGFGRTGRWFSFQRAGLEPDLVTLGKALSGGLPLSALAGPADLLRRWPPGMHTSTFQGNPLACAMAVANIDTIRDEGLIERVAACIEPALRRLEAIPGVRVIGAQAAIPVAAASAPSPAERVVAIQLACLAEGLLVYAGGREGESILLVPPLVIRSSDLAQAVERVRRHWPAGSG